MRFAFQFGRSSPRKSTDRISNYYASLSANEARIEAFRQGLRELGYVEGKNIVIESRSQRESSIAFRRSSTELVRLNVDVIVSAGPAATRPPRK